MPSAARPSPWRRWHQPGESSVLQYEIGSMKNFVYLIVDWTTREALWVDPQRDLSEPEADIAQHSLLVRGILLTHTHHDHIAGIPPLLEKYPGLPIHLHEEDRHRLGGETAPENSSSIRTIKDLEKLKLGELEIQALHMPGHSAGALSFLVGPPGRPECLLTGDTLFIRDCGRTDLPTGSTSEMFASLQRYKSLDPGLVILPGHHYREEFWSTLDTELRTSPPLQCRSIRELEALP